MKTIEQQDYELEKKLKYLQELVQHNMGRKKWMQKHLSTVYYWRPFPWRRIEREKP